MVREVEGERGGGGGEGGGRVDGEKVHADRHDCVHAGLNVSNPLIYFVH